MTMDLQHRRVSIVRAAAILAIAFASAVGGAQVITPTSVEGQNILTSAQFLQDNGMGAVANEIRAKLNAGGYSMSTTLKENAETSAVDGTVNLTPTLVHNTVPVKRNTPYDPQKDFSSVLSLSRTLFHENVHANHQNYMYKWWGLMPGETVHETDAWKQTIGAEMTWLFNGLATGKLTPKQISTLLGDISSYLADFKSNNYYGLSKAEQAPYTALQTFVTGFQTQIDNAIQQSQSQSAPAQDGQTQEGSQQPQTPPPGDGTKSADAQPSPSTDKNPPDVPATGGPQSSAPLHLGTDYLASNLGGGSFAFMPVGSTYSGNSLAGTGAAGGLAMLPNGGFTVSSPYSDLAPRNEYDFGYRSPGMLDLTSGSPYSPSFDDSFEPAEDVQLFIIYAFVAKALTPGRGALNTSQDSELEIPGGGLADSPDPAPRIRAVATGASTGNVLSIEVMDPAGKSTGIRAPEALIVQPMRGHRGKTLPSAPAQQVLSAQGYCLEFGKEPPEPNRPYRVAPKTAQEKFRPLRDLMKAADQLSNSGQLHPDSKPDAYLDAIRQYAIWAKLEKWDEKSFTEHFVERTHKNAEERKVKWTPQIEQALRAAAPNRWADISRVLSLAERSTASRTAN